MQFVVLLWHQERKVVSESHYVGATTGMEMGCVFIEPCLAIRASKVEEFQDIFIVPN